MDGWAAESAVEWRRRSLFFGNGPLVKPADQGNARREVDRTRRALKDDTLVNLSCCCCRGGFGREGKVLGPR